ncbi:hypothetical protein AAHC03_026483 [Spirometra sp. Aus1]
MTSAQLAALFIAFPLIGKCFNREVIPEASLPLSRFMGGHNEVSITFAAFVGQTDFSIYLHEGDKRICKFQNSMTDENDPQFCQLTFRNENKEVWFNGKFKKSEYKWATYEWHMDETFVSVFVNWTQTGNSSEDGVCLGSNETTENEMTTESFLTDVVMPNCAGLILLLVLNLLY